MDTSSDVVSIFQTIAEFALSSSTFSFLVGFLGLYSAVLFADIVLLFSIRPIEGDLKKGFLGSKDRPLASERRLKREWTRIQDRLETRVASDCKVAILEADAFADRMLSEMGYAGKSAGERLDGIPVGHFSSLAGLREAHEVRNRIVLERNYSPSREEAKRVLSLYRVFLEESEVLL